jgi:ribosomal protein S18 acetylase RimI-like enzyme/uncharacterized glyoxalase superfamily protein PhnB
MIRLQPITPACVADFKSTRLRALQDTPTAFGSTYAKESLLSDADWLRRATQWNSNRGISYLAWDNDQSCGIVACMIDETDPTKAGLFSMWVAPTHRRRGVGQLLVNAVIDWMKHRRLVALYLNVTSNNDPARRFYERLGFTKTGKTEPYPNDPALIEFEMVRPMTSTKFQTHITATLAVRNWPAAMTFYKSAFDAIETYSVPGGGVAQLSVNGADFWVAEESPEHQNFSPESLGGCSVRMLLIAENPAAICAQAIAAGAKEIYPVADNHGWRIGRIVDPFGHHWEIARQID